MVVYAPATMELRNKAEEAIAAWLQAAHEDRVADGMYEHLDEDDQEMLSMEGWVPTAWTVTMLYASFDHPEKSQVLFGNSGCPAPMSYGLYTMGANNHI